MSTPKRDDVVVHLCPPGDEAQFPCCGGWPLEHLNERMTADQDLVTCPGRVRSGVGS